MLVSEDIIDSLFSHHYFLLKLHDCLAQATEPTNPLPDTPDEPLDRLVDEISDALQAISAPSYFKDIDRLRTELESRLEEDMQELKSALQRENQSLVQEC